VRRINTFHICIYVLYYTQAFIFSLINLSRGCVCAVLRSFYFSFFFLSYDSFPNEPFVCCVRVGDSSCNGVNEVCRPRRNASSSFARPIYLLYIAYVCRIFFQLSVWIRVEGLIRYVFINRK
jgi:hypothetical protein